MSALSECRILVVEDEFLISTMLCDMLSDCEAVVVGPAASISSALELVRDNPVDAAILDINLNGQLSEPIAEELVRRRIPFVFTTGYGANSLSEKFGARTVEKPYVWEVVEEELTLAIMEIAKSAQNSI